VPTRDERQGDYPAQVFAKDNVTSARKLVMERICASCNSAFHRALARARRRANEPAVNAYNESRRRGPLHDLRCVDCGEQLDPKSSPSKLRCYGYARNRKNERARAGQV